METMWKLIAQNDKNEWNTEVCVCVCVCVRLWQPALWGRAWGDDGGGGLVNDPVFL